MSREENDENEENKQARYYRKKINTSVAAVQINLEMEGFTYRKWGAMQRCQRGDWLINSGNDCYTVSERSFKSTYREESPGRYVKHTLVRATIATSSGKISTQEGETSYSAGDYLIVNNDDESDCYAICANTFLDLYKLVCDNNTES